VIVFLILGVMFATGLTSMQLLPAFAYSLRSARPSVKSISSPSSVLLPARVRRSDLAA
jgi:hypothetical protein